MFEHKLTISSEFQDFSNYRPLFVVRQNYKMAFFQVGIVNILLNIFHSFFCVSVRTIINLKAQINSTIQQDVTCRQKSIIRKQDDIAR